jgi:hypothetical protein
MTETQETKDARNAVVYIEDIPCLELAADSYIYPVNTPGDRFKLMVAMRPYEPYSVKKFYDQMMPKRKTRSAGEHELVTSGDADLCEFVMAHFQSFSGAELEDGSEPTIEQQKEWLENNDAFMSRIFRNGVDALKLVDAPETTGKAILVFGQKEHRIEYELTLFSPERKTEETIQITAKLEKFSQSDKHKYEKAISFIENSRRKESFVEANWDVIEQLFNHKTIGMDGAVIDGKPCAADNREAWIKRLPLIHKLFVVGKAIQDIDIKNG